jgi:hypothetical protein
MADALAHPDVVAAPCGDEIAWRFSDSLLATDLYVAIAIARDDAKRYRAMYFAAIEQTHRQHVEINRQAATIARLRDERRQQRQIARAA